MTKGQLLKLRANDKEDLSVISTILQDSLITVNEMLFLKKESRFAFVANRFRWEDNTEKKQNSLIGKPDICNAGINAVGPGIEVI